MTPPPDAAWLAAVARAEVRGAVVTVPCGDIPRRFSRFSIAGFPCSGMDWVGRLLSLHPAVVVADPPRRLGPLGREPGAPVAPPAPGIGPALQASLVAAGSRPETTHVGVIIVSGEGSAPAPEIRVLRDGRDVLVAWTLRQFREEGEALQRFLRKGAAESRLPEIHRRFRADPGDLLERHPGLLLADYEWVRYAAHLWADDVGGHFSAMGARDDGRIGGPAPVELYYERARAAPREELNRLLGALGLGPLPAALVPDGWEADREAEPELREEWEVGRWRRFFTERAGRLFRLEAEQELEHVTEAYGEEWEGECEPAPE